MLIRLKHGYAIEIQASGWRTLSPAYSFVGLYETFTEAIHGAAQHYARNLVALSMNNPTAREVWETVTKVTEDFMEDIWFEGGDDGTHEH